MEQPLTAEQIQKLKMHNESATPHRFNHDGWTVHNMSDFKDIQKEKDKLFTKLNKKAVNNWKAKGSKLTESSKLCHLLTNSGLDDKIFAAFDMLETDSITFSHNVTSRYEVGQSCTISTMLYLVRIFIVSATPEIIELQAIKKQPTNKQG